MKKNFKDFTGGKRSASNATIMEALGEAPKKRKDFTSVTKDGPTEDVPRSFSKPRDFKQDTKKQQNRDWGSDSEDEDKQ